MTTYATPPVQPATQYGVPPAPPQPGDIRPIVPPPSRGDRGILTATSAFIIATSAAIATAMVLAHPVKPAEHTVTVEPPSPVTYSSSDIKSAKAEACLAWDKAARATATASKDSALTAPDSSTIETRNAARNTEKWVGASQIAYLRTQLSDAVPSEIAKPIEEWAASEIDRLHYLNMRDWAASDAALEKGNNLVDVILPGCGMR